MQSSFSLELVDRQKQRGCILQSKNLFSAFAQSSGKGCAPGKGRNKSPTPSC
ncbi:hypothetical protein ACRRTK_017379 [Alexandromys fortis]